MADAGKSRGQWGSKLGFILAAAGSAVGLGNIWRFPFAASEGGGGIFVLVYLVAVALVGLPVMIAEIIIGRRAQRSPVPAFSKLSGDRAAWSVVGWMGVAAGFLILSFYSVVAGWTMHYVFLSVSGDAAGQFGTLAELPPEVSELRPNVWLSLGWHTVFMAITMFIVMGGIKRGIETAARLLMPALFLMLIGLVVYAATLDGFGDAMSYLFEPHAERVSPGGILGGLGQAFFSLSLGMGALITYGSYLGRESDVPRSALQISLLDTAVALMAGLIMFPIILTAGRDPGEGGAGLVFMAMPLIFEEMSGGYFIGIAFFVLLFFAALTSAISLLEVVAATMIDQLGWTRRKATVLLGGVIYLFGALSAVSVAGGLDFWTEMTGKIFEEPKNFLDTMDYLTANWMLPLGGLLIALFVGWALPVGESKEEFETGSSWGGLFPMWLVLVRYVVPVVILAVFLVSIGVIPEAWLE